MQNFLLKVPIVFGADWAWPSRSNLTLFKNHFYLNRFCIFEIFVRRVCRTVPHPTWLSTHTLIPTCTSTGWRHGPWNSIVVYLGETTGILSASTRWLALDFTSCCRFSTYYTHITCQNFNCQHSAIIEITVKQCPLAFISFTFQQGKAQAPSTSALFLAR